MQEYREKLTDTLKLAVKFVTGNNRIFILAAVILVGFWVLVSNLFEQQIVQGTYLVPTVATFERSIPINAPRGQIFDVHGRPLAVSMPIITVMMDPSVIFDAALDSTDLNSAFQLLIDIMEKNNETLDIDGEFLISVTAPRTFLVTSENTQKRWKRDLGIDEDLNATEAYAALLTKFEINPRLSRGNQYTLLRLRAALYLQRFNITPVRLAVDINRTTVASLQEFSHAMPGVYIASDYLRYYPEGKYMSNILGYLGRMNETQLSNLAPLGYLPTDLIGQMGIESAFEDILRGTRGRDIIEVTRSGRRVAHLEHIPPTPGHDIFLTVDSVLQRNIYYHIENTLIALMRSRLWAEGIDFAREILASTLRANNINSLLIMNADPAEFPASGIIRDFVLRHAESYAAVNPAINPDEAGSAAAYRTALNEFIGDNILSGRVAMNTVFEVMAEQGIFEMTDAEINSLARGHISSTNFLLNLIESRRLTPQMANVEPATGSAVITCVKTGGIIAAVNYPTFNANNFLPHLRDNDYIAKVNNDPTRPLFARAFREANAPGSTFKMITAVAGLDQGVLTPTTQIHDNVVFRDAGHPYVHCMGSHGSINVVTALEASCNYFFNRVAWNLGNRHGGRTLEGIATLNYYMTALGLGSPTGVEVTEAPMVTAGRNSHPRIASPALRTALGHAGQWTDGMTSHVSIGQGYNDYTATSMAKVMATLANGGTRIQMHLLDRTVAANGEITPFETVIEYQLDIEPTHLQAIRQGMYNVPFGSRGTGRGIFAGFPIPIALKSGTAEVMGRISHSSYGGFAPYDNPQIAVYVMMPHGDSRYMRASAGYVMRDILSEYFGLNHSPTPAQNGGIR